MKNFLSFCKIILLVSVFLIFQQNLEAYTPLNKSEIKQLIPSDTRIVLNLHGKWKKTTEDLQTYVNIPKSETVQEQYTYEKTIRIEKKLIEDYAFQFYLLGFDDAAEIYINGQFLGRYFGGMTTFSVTIPPKMILGEMNTVKLIINPAESLVKKIKENTLFSKKTFTGIIREVFLVATPKIWVNELKYNVNFDNNNFNSANINVSYKVSTSEISNLLTTLFKDTLVANTMMRSELNAKVLVYDINNNLVAESNTQTLEVQSQRTYTLNSNLKILNPNLWLPENPYLYNLKVKVSKNETLIDELSTNLGLREIKTINANNRNLFSLNGKDFKIKSVSYIEDYGNSYQTLSPSRIEEDIAMIKTLGANVIRIKYNSPHPFLIHLCNKYGLLALVELPIYDVPSNIMNSDEVKVRMKNIMERNLVNLESNPSVMAYGVYAGADENSSELIQYESNIINLIKNNSDKLIYKIINISTSKSYLKGYDFIGIKDNVFKNNLLSIKNDIIRIQNFAKNIPLFVNYGIAIQPNNKNGYSDILSPEFQAFYLRNIFHLIQERELAGGCFNSFNDYRIENPLLISNNDNQLISYSGLVDINRNTRLSFKTLQTLYNQEKEPLLNVGNYNEKAPFTYIIVGILAISVVIVIFNKFKRFKEYLVRAIIRPYNFYSDIRDQRIISTVQTFILGFVLALSVGTFSSSLLYYYRSSEIAQYILMILIPFKDLQSFLFKIIWMPELLMVVFTFLYLILMFLVALLLRFSAIFIKNRVFLVDTVTISIWCGLPFIIILPFSIILVKILVNFPNSIWLISSLLIFISIWVLMRILRATAVVFDKQQSIINAIGGIIIFISIGLPVGIYQIKYQFFDYIKYIFNVIIGI